MRAMRVVALLVLCAATTACAVADAPVADAPVMEAPENSLAPGDIGVIVQGAPNGVWVAQVGQATPAAAAGLRPGDVIVRYNGVSIAGTRQFYRLTLDTVPGSTAELEIQRDGRLQHVSVRVEELDTMPRV